MKQTTLAVMAVAVLLAASARAEEASVVSGTGTVVVKKMPTIMRVSIQFRESGKDLPEALKTLKDRRDASVATFTKLGAKKDSIHEGTPTTAGEDPNSARAMAMMARPDGNPRKKKTGATKVTVLGKVTAEWALPEGNPEELLTFVQALKDKVQAADLAGQKVKKKLSAEEQEEIEEMEMLQQQHFGNHQEAKAGEPSYVFLAKISEEQQKKARAESFQKARAQAEQLAVAAGRKLGKLRGLQSHTDMQAAYMYNRFNDQGDVESNDGEDGDDESFGKSPVCAKIPFSFAVQASFDIAE